MKNFLVITLLFTFSYCHSQKLNTEYRTITDEHLRLHFLVFSDNSKCKLIYPITNHGDAMMGRKREYEFHYSVKNDTLILSSIDSKNADSIMNEFTQSAFIIRKDGRLYNCTSGYTYFDKRLVSDKYTIYAIDGKIYKQRIGKTNGYGLITKEFKQNKKLRRKLKTINTDLYTVQILKGQAAYEKYDIIGMNGIIEMQQKKE